MAGIFPNGTIYSMSTKLAAALAVSSITNAENPVCTVEGSTIKDGDVLVVQSGWSQLSGQVRRAIDASASVVALEGADTSDKVTHPEGAGIGSLVAVVEWIQLSQVSDVSTSGGDQNFYQWQWLEDRNSMQRQRPTYKNAMSIAMTLDYDDDLPWYKALTDADAKGEPVVLWAHLPNGADLYYYVYPSFNAEPTMTMNENSKVSATFSLQGVSTRYKKPAEGVKQTKGATK